ncbi:tetratricopeptide repeat-containing sensor histidine kinase [Neotamlana laminarinivorans]|uniref:histidine kinase n=1 Tax=Neotamlana laminarinivorans TaxID=2883124 RepID=A0A9X1I475_9FLAO|nr:ATP-binding protein [Tamlana laminarinivorans]MCB4799907.1 tetratricopeptide repeat-containing sensor histidine kinase [Tamlana laminarinivorans]
MLLIIISHSCSLFSQEYINADLFDVEVEKKVNQYQSNYNFKKAGFYYIQNNWDSTLVYSMRYLNGNNKNIDLTNYSHYLRGCSFDKKEMLNEAQNEFQSITSGFEFNFLIKKKLAEIALKKSEFKKAISYLEPLIKLKEKDYKYFGKSAVFQNLGLCYLHLNDFKKAEPYLIEYVKFNEIEKDTLNLIDAYGSIANLYYNQYKDIMAIPYFEKAYRLSKSIKDFKAKQIATINMAVVEENRKNFEKALVYRKEYEQWKDSLNDQNKIYEVAKLEKEYAVKAKQKEVNFLKVENKAKLKERNGLLYSALTLLILLGVTLYFNKEKTKANNIISAQKEKLDALNVTKDKLFSIVSHDLRSSVNALKKSNTNLVNTVASKNLKEVNVLLKNNSTIVNGAYNLLDNLLNWALLQTKQSYFEITSIRLFFIVEQVVYNYKPLVQEKNIRLTNTVLKSDIVFADQESLKIILRNLLDNAIKFTNNNGTIKVYTKNSNSDYYDLVIEDSGIGMKDSTRIELLSDTELLSKKENEDIIGSGLGLQLCKSMIKKNNGIFSIESELGKGTKMIVSLPKKV